MSDLNTKSIRFPAHSYVGFDSRPGEEDDFPLGFMTEDGTDKAAEKRKSTVDNWADKINAPRTLPNAPMVGFRLSRSIRRQSGWGTGNVKWRIEDPRGFELEISSPNLAQIISTCVIDGGVILNECMWARLGGDNVLVPTDSDLYQTTKRNSARQKMSVKPASVKVGNRIVLQNGYEGIYLGKMYEIRRNYGSDSHTPTVSEKPKPLILSEHNGKPMLLNYASLKVAEIIAADEITTKDAELIANQHGRWTVNFVQIPPIQLSPVDAKEVLAKEKYSSGLMLVHVPEFDNEWCVFSGHSSYHGIAITAIDKECLDNGTLIYKSWHYSRPEQDRLKPLGIEIQDHRWSYNNNRLARQYKSGNTLLNITTRECFRLYRSVTTETGNTFEWHVGT